MIMKIFAAIGVLVVGIVCALVLIILVASSLAGRSSHSIEDQSSGDPSSTPPS